MYDVIVIGGGTAGMTAALYILRTGKKVLILEAENVGGQIAYSPRVENYPGIPQISGSAFASQLFEQVLALGAAFELETVLAVRDAGRFKYVVTEETEYACTSVVIATGVTHRHLNIEGEADLAGSGISYCAVCDGAFFKDKIVAVAGGGNTALQSALFLSSLCKKVILIHRRDEFRAESTLVNQLRTKNNAIFLTSSRIRGLLGTRELEGLMVEEIKTGRVYRLPVEGLFVSIGQVPRNDCFAALLQLDENGYIAAGEDCRTSADGIFAAGDCRTKAVRQLTTAAADGAVAGLAACLYADEVMSLKS